jgi:hypothetical protein
MVQSYWSRRIQLKTYKIIIMLNIILIMASMAKGETKEQAAHGFV